jgi:hypothetical protein
VIFPEDDTCIKSEDGPELNCEIGPGLSYDGEGLKEYISQNNLLGKIVTMPLYLGTK